MLEDEFLFQAWPGGEVAVFQTLVNVKGVSLKHAAWSNWANFFGFVHMDDSMILLCRVTKRCQ